MQSAARALSTDEWEALRLHGKARFCIVVDVR